MKYVLIIEEKVDDGERVYSDCKAKEICSLSIGYKAFRKTVKEKIDVRDFPLITGFRLRKR